MPLPYPCETPNADWKVPFLAVVFIDAFVPDVSVLVAANVEPPPPVMFIDLETNPLAAGACSWSGGVQITASFSAYAIIASLLFGESRSENVALISSCTSESGMYRISAKLPVSRFEESWSIFSLTFVL